MTKNKSIEINTPGAEHNNLRLEKTTKTILYIRTESAKVSKYFENIKRSEQETKRSRWSFTNWNVARVF